MARSNFHRRTTQAGENSQQFVTALRALAAKCNYRDEFVNELLLDRFMAGCTNEKIRERLLMEPDTLTLEQALILAANIERATVETKTIQSTGFSEAAVQRIQKQSASNLSFNNSRTDRSALRQQKQQCYYCGNTRHQSKQECPAFKHVCKKCSKTGHY